MIAAGNRRRHRFTSVQLAITGLLMVVIGGCKSVSAPPAPAPGPPPKVGVASGADTPIVISGGSIHFRATKKSNWTACPSNGTNCYMAPFNNKSDLVNYQFVDENFVETAVPVTSGPKVTNGWEIDVLDTNTDNEHMVLICAQVTADYTACDNGPLQTQDQNIYVIAKGSGASFDPPKGPGKYLNRIEYHDGNKKYDYVGSISLNASGGAGGQQTLCTDNACDLFLSK